MIKRNPFGIFILLLLVLALSGMATARAAGPQTPEAPVGGSFTYQGRLIDGGAPANGAYDLRFSLYDAESGGAPVSGMLARDEVTVGDGYFTVALDFGAAFDGTATWLEVEVRPGASAGSYTVLAPRTPLAGVPYALGLMPGAVVNTSEVNVPAITVSAPFSNSNALVATGTGDGYAVVFAEDQSSAGGYALYGKSSDGNGVYGESNRPYANANNQAGVFGRSTGSSQGVGVLGEALGVGGFGVIGRGHGRGVVADGGLFAYGRNPAVEARSVDGFGVIGGNDGLSSVAPGVYGYTLSASAGATGVTGEVSQLAAAGSSSAGVLGINNGTGASGIGVWGTHDGAGYGVYGSTNPGGYGVVGSNGGSNTSGYAGSFNGRVAVAGTLSKGGGSFKIDHPLDPANKYLSHSFVESPDMMNIYNGMTTLDANGRATVILPDWFEALNHEFRYQLTAVGAAMPNLHVAEKIAGNRFSIAGGQPAGEVSWQVTGIRHDPFAEAYRIPVEEEKVGDERGRYLYPDVYGRSAQDSIWYATSPNARYLIDHPEALQRPGPDALHAGVPAQRPDQ